MKNEQELFSFELINALRYSRIVAKENFNEKVYPQHLLLGLLHKDTKIKEALFNNNIDVFYLEEWAEIKIEALNKSTTAIDCPPFDETTETIIMEAFNNNLQDNDQLLNPIDVLATLSIPGIGFNYDELKSFPINCEQILEISENRQESPVQQKQISPINQPDYLNDLLSNYPKNNTINVVERDQEILNLLEIIGRKEKPHVVITGEKGIGKTILIQGITTLIKAKKTSSHIKNSRLFELKINKLLTGITHKGELDERLRNVFKYLGKLERPILFIDDIQVLLDDAGNGKSIYFLIKNQLIQSDTILICTASNEAYRKLLEKDNPLQEFFEKFNLHEPDQERASLMIYSNKDNLEQHHKVTIDHQTIKEAVRLAKRYLPETNLPESAIKLIDTTMSSIRTQLDIIPAEIELNLEKIKQENINQQIILTDLIKLLKYSGLETEEKPNIKQCKKILNQLKQYISKRDNKIKFTDLAGSIGRTKNIPVGKIVTKEKERLLQMNSVLQKTVIGQNMAIQSITDAILESRSGLNKPGMPIGSFFLLGPTGTGKTELAKQLAQYLFQSTDALIRFDMSEFKEEHSAALLYGAPPGYVGYEEGGMLVNKIRQKPYSVVLFDEIEKAHPSVFDIFLQILDEGKLQDRLGKTGYFSNAVILFTSNIGSEIISKQYNQERTLPEQTTLMESMALHFRPEFLGRLSALLPFAPITEEMIGKIFDIQISELETLLSQQGIEMKISKEAKLLLSKKGFNPQYGARPLRSIIRSHLRTPLSRMIISGALKQNEIITIKVNKNQDITLVKESARVLEKTQVSNC